MVPPPRVDASRTGPCDGRLYASPQTELGAISWVTGGEGF